MNFSTAASESNSFTPPNREVRCCRLLAHVSVAASYLLISGSLRLILWSSFGRSLGSPLTHLPAIIGIGILNDLITLTYLLMPLTLFAVFIPDRVWRSAIRWRAFPVALAAILFGLIYLAAVEYFFFDEFGARFNLVAVDYLMYPTEVFGNIWSSYPVGFVVIGSAAVSVALSLPFWRVFRASPAEGCRLSGRVTTLLIHLLLLVGVVSISSDSIAPARNRVEREIESNGLTTFFEALRTHDILYNDFYMTQEAATAFRRIRSVLGSEGLPFASAEPFDLRRIHPPQAKGFGRMNVVVIVEESFGSNFIGAAGARTRLTPYFDSLARRGVFFTQTFATGTRTVRGLEAITLSFPPIPSESILKRPNSGGMATWGSVMRSHGYNTSFLYGGYATFDNLKAFYSSNGFEVIDRTDFDRETFGNIWGACDQDLFRNAIRHFDERSSTGEPFFSILMTTSNHKPFTFPKGIPGIPPEGGGRHAGIRYADYALGEFVRNASSHPWFDRTLFVIIADHGARVYGSAEIPLPSYRIPFLIYAPGRLQPRRIDALTSQLDAAPTVLGLLGFSYTAPFYGRDAFIDDARPHDLLLSHNHDVALFRDGRMAVLGLNRAVATYRVDPRSALQTKEADDGALIADTVAYYQTAFDEFRTHRYQ